MANIVTPQIYYLPTLLPNLKNDVSTIGYELLLWLSASSMSVFVSSPDLKI